jgi:hypothetical protein
MEGPEGFESRAIVVEPGGMRIYNETEWQDALVVVLCGEIELEAVGGASARFKRGAVLCLAGLGLRALRTRGTEPAVLVAVSRR